MSTTAGIRLDHRDLEFLSALGRYGLLTTEDAHDFYPGLKRNSVQKRLRLLVGAGVTRATKLAVWFADDQNTQNGGRIPSLHSLTETGASLVESQTGQRPQRVLRSHPTPATFLHRREIVRVMRAFDLGCDAVSLARPNWVMEQDPWAGAPRKVPPNQRRLLYHEFDGGLTCLPDIACRFRIGQTELALFWEVDLSTEGKKQLRKASKTDGYVRLFNDRAFHRYWPDLATTRCYVIWVFPTSKRIATLREVLSGHMIAPACRLLSAKNLDQSSTLLTTEVWETVDGERRVMYRPTRLGNVTDRLKREV
ncbi:MAG: hypothetical protein KDA80_24695 [Planctomycetaceae bacterium]|nr:hypothetical protein [Planctomycetaceae bacterium]